MSDAIYRAEDGRFAPSGHARGPWDADSQHGGGPAALLARAIERLDAPGSMLVARLTVEFLRPAPLVPLEVRAEIVRPGRRLQLAEAHVLADGEEVLRARAVRLRREPVAVPAPTPVQRTLAAADFGNGLAAELAFHSPLFVDTDLGVHLLREPRGEWIAVEGVTEHGPEGTALASSVLHDLDGPIGRAQQSLFVDARQ